MSPRRFRVLLATVAGLSQIPILLWLCQVSASVWPAALGLIVSAAYLRNLRSPWEMHGAQWVAKLALGWWSTSLAFAMLTPFVWVATRVGLQHGEVVALVVAVIAGVSGIANRPKLKRRTVRVEGLPAALEGYRIGQLSDVHCGPHIPGKRVRRWVQRLNDLNLDLVAVTGDLIASGPTHVREVASALGELRAKDGVFACMGNHDYFTDGEAFVVHLENAGLTVLRNRGVTLERNGAQLFVAGADDTWTRRDDVVRALQQRPENTTSVLLAHDPDLFPQAAANDVDLTLSGHTHGGQLGFPGSRHWSLARFITSFTAGLYRRGKSSLYVSRGAGTSGPPVRFGAPAEITVLTLRAA